MQARIVPRDHVEQALYHASRALSDAKTTLLGAIATLTDTRLATQQTAEYLRSSDDLVSVGGVHLSAAQFADKFRIARQEDADAVDRVLVLLKEAAERLPVDEIIALANRDGA